MNTDLKFSAQIKRKYFWVDRLVSMKGTRLIYHEKSQLI